MAAPVIMAAAAAIARKARMFSSFCSCRRSLTLFMLKCSALICFKPVHEQQR
jgi:hypothetical protein